MNLLSRQGIDLKKGALPQNEDELEFEQKHVEMSEDKIEDEDEKEFYMQPR